jgi:hypothetical protein
MKRQKVPYEKRKTVSVGLVLRGLRLRASVGLASAGLVDSGDEG